MCHRVTITVDEPFTQEIADRNSESFKDFSEHFSLAVDNLLKDIHGSHKTMVINVERYSIGFNLKLIYSIICFASVFCVSNHNPTNDNNNLGIGIKLANLHVINGSKICLRCVRQRVF